MGRELVERVYGMRLIKGIDWEKYLLPLVFVGFAVLFAIINPAFLSARNIVQTTRQGAILFFLVCGQMLPLVTRGIDLSQGSVMSLTSVSTLSFIYVLGPYLGSAAGILTGTFCGLVNGVLIGYVGIPAILVTLSMLFLASGVTLVHTGGVTLTNLTEIHRIKLFWFGGEMVGPFPVPVIFALVIAIVVYYVFKYTLLGRHIWFVGANPDASAMGGVNIKRTILIVYTISAFMASLASFFLTSRLCMGFPRLGEGWLVLSIGGAIVGGTSVQGGKGGVWNAILGAAILVVLDNGLIVSGFSTFAREAIIGAIIIIACSISLLRSRV